MKRLVTLCSLLGLYFSASAQCTTIGQTPGTAFPICGTSTFHQETVPTCSSHNILVPPCSGDGASYQDKNPFWYKFTCYQSGTLGFLVQPKDQQDDYDWMLYDITGHDPNAVFSDKSLIVTGNWAGTFGNTGASSAGVSFIQCASDPAANKNSFSKMPNVIAGHTYLLLISHFTDSQSGYDLSFHGGTAVITDTTLPHLKAVETNCAGDTISIKLSKRIKCSSLAVDGSDFALNPSAASISRVTGVGCSSGFDTDSIVLLASTVLPSGDYRIQMQVGKDGNTLLDYCDNEIPTSDSLKFTIAQHVPIPMDSMVPLKCAPSELHIIFSKPIDCSTIAADGSDFAIAGTYPVSIAGAHGNCNGSSGSREVIVVLSKPLQTQGNFNLTLQSGSDGNALIDVCGDITQPGAHLTFSVKDTVNADFRFVKSYGCLKDTIRLFHPGGNGIESWTWNLDDGQTSAMQNPVATYSLFTTKNISLVVTNGFCSDSSQQSVLLDNAIKADFSVEPDNCPNEAVVFTSGAQGHFIKNLWTFGDGGSSTDLSPSHTYGPPPVTKTYTVSYSVFDSLGCRSDLSKPVNIYVSCYLAVPTAFTPNGDGLNDIFHVLNAVKTVDLQLKVYNRWGQLVFQTNDWRNGWDGSYKGQPQPSGIYIWYLSFKDRDTHQARFMKGTTALIR